jgi:UDP-N-acetylmuramoyl-tripeptide--D-alanyl-D-alanine ligase
LGAYNFPNILAALTIGKLFGVDSRLAHEAVAAYAPTNNRSQVLQRPHYQIIMDAYNANPSSMRAALENLHHIQTSYKTAILGDMFELGTESMAKHRELLDIARELSINQLLVCGKDFLKARKNNDTALFFEDKEKLKSWLAAHPIQQGIVLLKGSRGMGLESLLEVL